MNLPTKIALTIVAVAIIVPLALQLRKRMLGRVNLRFAKSTLHPDEPIIGTIKIRTTNPGRTGPVRLTLRLTERFDDEDHATLNTCTHVESHFILNEGLWFTSSNEQKLEFSVKLPADPVTREKTAHATHGESPRCFRRNYHWWCIVEVNEPSGITLYTMQRIPLAIV